MKRASVTLALMPIWLKTNMKELIFILAIVCSLACGFWPFGIILFLIYLWF